MRVAAVGDLVVMRPLAHVRERPAESLLELFDGADLAIGNLEVPLTAVDNPQRQDMALKAGPHLIADVAALGLDAVSIANNHCGDHGWDALAGMAAALRAAGTVPLGIGEDAEAAFREVTLAGTAVVTATCVGFEAYFATAERPGMAGVRVATEQRPDAGRLRWEPGTPPRAAYEVDPGDRRRLLAAVAAARSVPMPVVALMHWGVSYSERVEGYQRDLAHDLVEAGAGAVFGCHSHTVDAVEVHRGAPIFYGLGSFVFGYDGPLAPRMARDTAVALVDLGPDGAATAARLVIGRLDQAGEPVRAHPERVAHLAEALARGGAGWGASLRQDGDVLAVELA